MLGIANFLAAGTSATDRRRGRRFNLQMKCHVSSQWNNFAELAGVTTDISRSGVRVTFDDSDVSGLLKNKAQAIRIVIELPRSPNFPSRCLECMGNVARIVEAGTDRPSVAFEIKRIRVKDLAQKASESAPSLRGFPIRGRIQ